MTEAQIRTVAFHEAGHALAAHMLDISFSHVTIEPDEDSLGHLLIRPYLTDFNAETFADLTPVRRDRVERRIIVALAGPEAQRLHTGRYDRRGARGDIDTVMALVTRMPYSEAGCKHFYQWLKDRAYWMVAKPPHRVALEGIAEALVHSRRLTPKAVRSAIATSVTRALRPLKPSA